MDFSVPQINSNIPLEGNAPPDLLAQFIKGQMASYQVPMAQMELQRQALGLQQGQQNLQLGQQQLEKGPLELEQLRMILGKQQALMGALQGGLNGPTPGDAPGGVQSGPQSTVSTGPALPSGGSNGFVGGGMPDPATGLPLSGFSPHQLTAIGALAPEMMKGLNDAQSAVLAQRKLQAQGPLDLIDSVFNSAAPARTVMANPSLMAQWPKFAAQMGIDPVKGFNDQNVRAALAMAGNQLRGATGQESKQYPVPEQNLQGPYGQQLQRDPVTGKLTEVAGRQIPTYSMEPDVDLTTGKTNLRPVQIGGLTQGGQTPYAAGGPPVHSGYKEGVTPDEAKTAAFSQTFASSDKTMRQIENGGDGLSAKDRAALVNIVSSEDPSIIKQLASQEFLIRAMPEHTQSYITAAIPMIEALSHNQAGVRLPGNVIRAALESAIPINSMSQQQLRQTRDYRDNYQSSLDIGAGKAAFTGEFAGSIGARRTNASPQNPTGRRVPTRTGTLNGRKVAQFDDGSIEYAD